MENHPRPRDIGNLIKKSLVIPTALCFLTIAIPETSYASLATGEDLFRQNCSGCHTVNGGERVGPALANIHKRRSEQWLVRFINSSQVVINNGDPYAVELYEKFGRIIMPDYNFSELQVKKIINYIVATSDSGEIGGDPTQPITEVLPTTKEDIQYGRLLFVGKKRFVNGGPACNSCHNIDRQGIFTGGALAKGLTNVYTRMGDGGIRSIINNPPFPVMQKAYEGKDVSREETLSLVVFLQSLTADMNRESGPNYGTRLFLSGFVGSAILFGFFFLVRTHRKKTSVYHEIYQRQVKSTQEEMVKNKRIG
jgi:hypothetical protein